MPVTRFVIALLALLLPALAFAVELHPANDATIRAALASGKPSVVDFGARTCIPCKKMAPILEELNRELTGKFLLMSGRTMPLAEDRAFRRSRPKYFSMPRVTRSIAIWASWKNRTF